jgi:glycosyltransferase involved in cell wall biosynthesis
MSLGPATGQQSAVNVGDVCTNLVSIIITCYNQAHFLSESIQSALSQTYSHFEIIVIDDGSMDQPEQVATRYPGVCFIHQDNQGAAAARNRGLRESHGRFLVFLDADDRLLPEALQAGLDCFHDYPNCAFVFGQGRLIDSAGDKLPTPYLAPFNDGGYEQLLRRCPIGFPALVMFQRSAIESVGGFRSFIKDTFIGNTADYDLYFRLASCYPIRCYETVIAEWRQHTTNTSQNSLMMLKCCVSVFKAQRDRVRGNKQYKNALNEGLKHTQDYYGEMLIEELRAQVKAHEVNWHNFILSLMALVRYYPEGLVSNALRKMRRVVIRTELMLL